MKVVIPGRLRYRMAAMSRIIRAALLLTFFPCVADAQGQFFYPSPAPGTVTVSKDVRYGGIRLTDVNGRLPSNQNSRALCHC